MWGAATSLFTSTLNCSAYADSGVGGRPVVRMLAWPWRMVMPRSEAWAATVMPRVGSPVVQEMASLTK